MQSGILMRRTSYLAELDMRYVFAIHCPIYQVGEGTTFQSLLIEYTEHYYDKSDVLSDIREYLTLLKKTDAVALCSRILFRI
jgi:hypothetical protein